MENETEDFKAEEYAAAILSLRNAREQLLAGYEKEDAVLKEQMKVLEVRMLAECNKLNADSIKTPKGTIIRKLQERFICTDWGNFRDFELANRDYDFRERRIAQGSMKSYLAEHAVDGVPPGINAMREYTITVRKPS